MPQFRQPPIRLKTWISASKPVCNNSRSSASVPELPRLLEQFQRQAQSRGNALVLRPIKPERLRLP